MNKKGSTVDLFLIIPFLLVLGIVIIVVFMGIGRVNDTGIFDTTPDAQTSYTQGRNSLLAFDNLMMFIIIGLSLFVIISGAFVWNHPAFLIIGFILLIIALTVSGVISNAWMDFAESDEVSGYVMSFPKLDFILSRLPFYILFMGISASISMFIGYKKFEG